MCQEGIALIREKRPNPQLIVGDPLVDAGDRWLRLVRDRLTGVTTSGGGRTHARMSFAQRRHATTLFATDQPIPGSNSQSNSERRKINRNRNPNVVTMREDREGGSASTA